MPIRKTSKGYKIKNVAGVSKTRKSAERRLKAIKSAQSKRKKKKRGYSSRRKP